MFVCAVQLKVGRKQRGEERCSVLSFLSALATFASLPVFTHKHTHTHTFSVIIIFPDLLLAGVLSFGIWQQTS